MAVVKQTARGIEYIEPAVLAKKKTTFCQACLWRIPHNSGTHHLALKIGRYRIDPRLGIEVVDTNKPKSQLTLDADELDSLVEYLNDHYGPVGAGVRKYLTIPDSTSDGFIENLRALVERSDSSELISAISESGILTDDVLAGIEWRRRATAVQEFEDMLDSDEVEVEWQDWFKKNDWVLKSDCVRILDERSIDVGSIADYLVEGYDGFLDIIEIKRPEGTLRFWHAVRDHGNLIPSADLVKAITQCQNYLYEIEREMNSRKFAERMGVAVVKPRSILIFGRSCAWGDDEREAFRILNRSYSSLTIMTYDQVLERARKIIAVQPAA